MITWNELQSQARNIYAPAFAFRGPFKKRIIVRWARIVWALIALGVLVLIIGVSLPGERIEIRALSLVAGITSILLASGLKLFALITFYNSYYFQDISDGSKTYTPPALDFELAWLLNRTNPADPLASYLATNNGMMTMLRAGITGHEVAEFIAGRKQILTADQLSFDTGVQTSGATGGDSADNTKSHTTKSIEYKDYVLALFDTDSEFSQFLFTHEIQRADLLAITSWIIEDEITYKSYKRWWSRDRLGRIPGIGKNWSYGQIYTLDAYSRSIPPYTLGIDTAHDAYGSKEQKELEAILVRSTATNVFLVGDDISGNMRIISRLDHMIDEGTVLPQLQHKRIVLLDTDLLTVNTESKSVFEMELIKIMREAINAGNIILVFPDFPAFVKSAAALGSEITSLLDPYLTSGAVQIIGMTDTDRFHEVIERNTVLMERFDKILIEEIDESHTIRVLQTEIIPIEAQSGLIFSYPALVAVAESATRYFPDAVMPERAVQLLQELAPQMISVHKELIQKSDVMQLVETKTGIPVGVVSGIEKDKLLGLESILHERIVGQNEAVTAIANAVRRARSGINNPNRPLGSFLFLGPTGVGKTETTKALAAVFFKNESSIERLDMSEFATPDALEKLIGSFENGKAGILSNMLREHPYGVLLLDEFEKTTPEVMNLFLQILDEGSFSDMAGKHINAKNLLIIATSNAGSDLIWDAMEKGRDIASIKDEVTDAIIKARIFKPELLNRFDGVILFHPLSASHLEGVARKQLDQLRGRLKERGFTLVINDELVKFVTKHGTDPKFGARPMNRAIQDKVEQIIAEKLIRGDIKPGSEIVLSASDLS